MLGGGLSEEEEGPFKLCRVYWRCNAQRAKKVLVSPQLSQADVFIISKLQDFTPETHTLGTHSNGPTSTLSIWTSFYDSSSGHLQLDGDTVASWRLVSTSHAF